MGFFKISEVKKKYEDNKVAMDLAFARIKEYGQKETPKAIDHLFSHCSARLTHKEDAVILKALTEKAKRRWSARPGSTTRRMSVAGRSRMAVFTIAKGGLMYEVTLGVQKFNYEPI